MRAVFVSSTFKDMQFERDMLNIRVIPRINDFLSKYAENVHFGDLRWGVNTTELESEESSKKILRVCLDQIDDCKPYMIVFVGERYGWIPSSKLIHEAAKLKGMDEHNIKDDISVTELEIEYGALLDPDFEGRILFYFRRPFDVSKMPIDEQNNYLAESPQHQEKINTLKKKILSKYEKYVRYYDVCYNEETKTLDGLDELSNMIVEDLKKIFDIDLTYINSLPKEERAINNSINHFEKLAKDSYIREKYSLIKPSQEIILEIIQGFVGAGAKTIVAQKYQCACENNLDTFAFSYELDNFTNDIESFTSSLIYKLEELLNKQHMFSNDFDYLCNLITQYSKLNDKELHIFTINMPDSFIKYLHQIESSVLEIKNIYFYIHFRENLKVDVPIPFFRRNVITNILALDDNEKVCIIKSILKSKKKELSDVVIKEIINHQSSNNPLYLSLIVERLMMLDYEDFLNIRNLGDGMDNINKYMIQIIKDSGDNIEDISHNLLKELSERINPLMIPHLIYHISLQKHFDDDSIRYFFEYCNYEYNYLDYVLFKKTIPSLFHNTLDNIFYANNDVKKGALRLLNDYSYDSHILKVIEFLKSNDLTISGKSIVKMLYVNNDPKMLLDFCLPYLDVPLDVLYNKSPADKYNIFKIIYEAFMQCMYDSFKENTVFSKDVIKYFIDKICEGKIKYPYTLISIIFNYLEVDYGNELSIIDYFLHIDEIMKYIDLQNVSNMDELGLINHILRVTHIESMMYYLNNTKYANDITSQYMKIRNDNLHFLPLINKLVKENKLFINNLSNIKIISYINFYKLYHDSIEELKKFNILDVANRTINILNNNYDFLNKVLNNDLSEFRKQEIKETILGLSLIIGKKYFLEKNYSEANKYYDVVYILFKNYYKKASIDERYASTIVYIMSEYLNYGIRKFDQEVLMERYNEIFNWCMKKQADLYNNVEILFNIIDMFIDGIRYEIITNADEYFMIIFGKIIKLIKYNKDIFGLVKAVNLYIQFAYLFNDDDKISYFVDIIYELICSVKMILSSRVYEYLKELINKFINKYNVKVDLIEKIITKLRANSDINSYVIRNFESSLR